MTARLGPAARRQWLLDWADRRGGGLESTNRALVDAYVLATGAGVRLRVLGADYCPQLARDLLALLRLGELERFAVGIGDGLPSQGLPTWCWVYRRARAPKGGR